MRKANSHTDNFTKFLSAIAKSFIVSIVSLSQALYAMDAGVDDEQTGRTSPKHVVASHASHLTDSLLPAQAPSSFETGETLADVVISPSTASPGADPSLSQQQPFRADRSTDGLPPRPTSMQRQASVATISELQVRVEGVPGSPSVRESSSRDQQALAQAGSVFTSNLARIRREKRRQDARSRFGSQLVGASEEKEEPSNRQSSFAARRSIVISATEGVPPSPQTFSERAMAGVRDARRGDIEEGFAEALLEKEGDLERNDLLLAPSMRERLQKVLDWRPWCCYCGKPPYDPELDPELIRKHLARKEEQAHLLTKGSILSTSRYFATTQAVLSFGVTTLIGATTFLPDGPTKITIQLIGAGISFLGGSMGIASRNLTQNLEEDNKRLLGTVEKQQQELADQEEAAVKTEEVLQAKIQQLKQERRQLREEQVGTAASTEEE